MLILRTLLLALLPHVLISSLVITLLKIFNKVFQILFRVNWLNCRRNYLLGLLWLLSINILLIGVGIYHEIILLLSLPLLMSHSKVFMFVLYCIRSLLEMIHVSHRNNYLLEFLLRFLFHLIEIFQLFKLTKLFLKMLKLFFSLSLSHFSMNRSPRVLLGRW